MRQILLERFFSSDQGTFGRIWAGPGAWFTGELPWRDNRTGISCIPPGLYKCAWELSPHFKRFMYGILGVPSRSGERVHSANLMGDRALGYKSQLLGCVALGKNVGRMDGQRALLMSRPAVSEFELEMDEKAFMLEVVNGFG